MHMRLPLYRLKIIPGYYTCLRSASEASKLWYVTYEGHYQLFLMLIMKSERNGSVPVTSRHTFDIFRVKIIS